MKKIKSKKYVKRLTWLCTLVYFASYFARTDFAAVLTAFTSEEGIDSAKAGLIITAAFFSYGLGQLVSGYLGDKLSPKYIILSGFAVTGIMNLLMPLVHGIGWQIVLWSVNGLAHAMMWPPMAKILSSYLTAPDYVSASLVVSIGGSVGTIAVYLAAAGLLLVSGWKMILLVAAVLSFAVGIIWYIGMTSMEKYIEKYGEEDTINLPERKAKHSARLSLKNVHWKRAVILIMIAIVAQGYLRDGITTWMPQYLKSTYGLDTSGSLLATVLLPVFTILTMEITTFVYRNFFRNEVTCASVIFCIAAVGTVALTAFFDVHIALSLGLVMLINGCTHGVNLILICMVSPHFQNYGKTSLMSGALNFCTYIGSGTATYTIALIFGKFGWRWTIASWSIIAIVGAVCCILAIKLWKRFLRSAEEA